MGSTSITLQFELDRNIDAAAQDVQTAISRTHPAAAAGHAVAAVVQQGQPVRSADLLPRAELADAAALAGQRIRGDDSGAADFDGRRRRAGAACSARRSSRCASISIRCNSPRATSASTRCRRRFSAAARAGRPARSTARTRTSRSSRRTASCSAPRNSVRSSSRIQGGRPVRLERSRARLRRRRERQDRELGRRHARDLSVGPAPAGHEHRRGRRCDSRRSCRELQAQLPASVQLVIRSDRSQVDSRVGARRQVHAGADGRAS